MGNEQSGAVKYGERLDNDISVSWNALNTVNPYPPRDGHVACSVGGKLFVFGGVTRTADGDNVESNDLLVFDTDTGSWSKVEVKGEVPAPRSSATMSAVGSNLFLFGGLSHACGWFEDVYMFDTVSCQWSPVETQGHGPSPRDKLRSAVVGSNIYVFGGFGPKSAEEDIDDISGGNTEDDDYEDEGDQEGAEFGWFNELFVLDTETRTWTQPMHMNLGVPTPRAAFGMCAVNDKLVIFGGRDQQCRRNDLHIFDTTTKKWLTDLKVSGRQPEPRSFHTATSVGGRVVILGGRSQDNKHFNDFHIFDTESLEWLQPKTSGNPMHACGCHTTTIVGDQLVVFGGSGDFHAETQQCQSYHGDLFTVSTHDILSGKSIPLPAEANQENVPANVPSQQPVVSQKEHVVQSPTHNAPLQS